MACQESTELSDAIARDPRSAGWTLDSTMSGHLHEAERLFTLAGEKKLAEASAKRKPVPLAGITLRPCCGQGGVAGPKVSRAVPAAARGHKHALSVVLRAV